MSLNRVLGPSANVEIKDVLQKTKQGVFNNLNCVQVGSIVKYDAPNNMAEVQISYKRKLPTNEIVTYPVLTECPVVFLSGGDTYLSFPIQPDDSCLILFNDRDLDTWWQTGEINVPPTSRAHSLSDAIVLVGVRNQSNKAALVDDKIELNGATKPILLRNEATFDIKAKKTTIDATAEKIVLKNDAQSFQPIFDALVQELAAKLMPLLADKLLTEIANMLIDTPVGPATGAVAAASKVKILALKPEFEAIKSNLQTVKSDFDELFGG